MFMRGNLRFATCEYSDERTGRDILVTGGAGFIGSNWFGASRPPAKIASPGRLYGVDGLRSALDEDRRAAL